MWRWFGRSRAVPFVAPSPWVDMHTHVLPGIDDGAQTPAQALDMLRAAQAIGITHVVATTHYTERYATPHAAVRAAFDGVVAGSTAAGIGIRLALGREVSFTDQHLAAVRADAGLRMPNARFALVEAPEGLNSSALVEGFFALSVAGIQPILAHPERSWTLQQRPATIANLRQRGVLVQLDAKSVVGRHGGAAKRLALALLADDEVDMLSSDAHCPEDFAILQHACGVVQARCGAALATQLVSATPAQTLVSL
jgi:protein-tyrosine phosphatase